MSGKEHLLNQRKDERTSKRDRGDSIGQAYYDDDEDTLTFSKKKRSRTRRTPSTTTKSYLNPSPAHSLQYDTFKGKRDKSNETSNTDYFQTLLEQSNTTRYWKLLTCVTISISVIIVLAAIGFVIYNACFIKPIIKLDQIQVFRLPINPNDPVVGFNIHINTYNNNWRPLHLDDCTFMATVADISNQVSYEISQPIVLHNKESILNQISETCIEQQVLLNLTKEANVEKLSEAIIASVLYRASKYIALKFTGSCEAKNSMGWKWNIPMERNQQYSLRSLKNK
jgi:hypothetical protein